MPKRSNNDNDDNDDNQSFISSQKTKIVSKLSYDDDDIPFLVDRLKNIFLNVTKTPEYFNYIEYLIKRVAYDTTLQTNPYHDSTIWSDKDLAAHLVQFGVLPPMPEIIGGEYYDLFSKIPKWLKGSEEDGTDRFQLLEEYIQTKQQSGGKIVNYFVGGKRYKFNAGASLKKRRSCIKRCKSNSKCVSSCNRKKFGRKTRVSARKVKSKTRSTKRKSVKRVKSKKRSTKRKSVKRVRSKKRSTKRKSVKRVRSKKRSTKH